MTKRKTVPKIKRLHPQNEPSTASGELNRDDKINADDLVGVHIIGSEDTQRHFGASKTKSSKNDRDGSDKFPE